MRAVRFWMAAYQTGAVAPKPRPGATAEAERIALTPEGAAYLATENSAETAKGPRLVVRLHLREVSHRPFVTMPVLSSRA